MLQIAEERLRLVLENVEKILVGATRKYFPRTSKEQSGTLIL